MTRVRSPDGLVHLSVVETSESLLLVIPCTDEFWIQGSGEVPRTTPITCLGCLAWRSTKETI